MTGSCKRKTGSKKKMSRTAKQQHFDPPQDENVEVMEEESNILPGNPGNRMDEAYFRSYSDIRIHEEMLADTVRTNCYRYSILKNYEMFRGKVVADIGAGTGILSVFAAQAGAKKVYAMEASSMAMYIPAVVKENGLEGRVEVIAGKVEDAMLPEAVDVIVSEWMGYCLLYESMLNSLINARDRFLKLTGAMFPGVASLYMAPITDDEYEDRIAFWKSDLLDSYKVSMESIIPLAKRNLSKTVIVKTVSQENVLSHAQVISRLNLKTVTENDLKKIQKCFSFFCFGHSIFHGFVFWFDVEFPHGIKLSTSPYSAGTHWQQAVVLVDSPVTVEQDSVIKGSVSLSPNKTHSRHLDIHLSYKVGNGATLQKYYYMNDDI